MCKSYVYLVEKPHLKFTYKEARRQVKFVTRPHVSQPTFISPHLCQSDGRKSLSIVVHKKIRPGSFPNTSSLTLQNFTCTLVEKDRTMKLFNKQYKNYFFFVVGNVNFVGESLLLLK